MAIWDRFLDNWAERRGLTKASGQVPAILRTLAETTKYEVPDYALADNQLKLYQAHFAVYTAVTMVAQACAGQMFNVMRRVREDTEDIPNHPFEELLRRPNPTQSRFELIEATAAAYTLGNAYWYLNMAGPKRPPTEIWVLPSNRVKPIPGDKWGLVDGYEFDDGTGTTKILPPQVIVHFKRFHPRSPFIGLSPVETIAVEAETDYKASKYQLSFFADKDARPEAILSFESVPPDPLWDKMQAEFNRKYGGKRTGLGWLRGGKVDLLRLGLSQEDMQYLASRQFTEEQIFKVFAPGLASMLAINATEANSRTGLATFMARAVWPKLVAIAEGITRSILPLYGDRLHGEFDDPRLSDRAMELQEQAAAAQVMTVNELRSEYYQLDALPGMRGELFPAEIGPQSAMMAVGLPALPQGGPNGGPPETQGMAAEEQAMMEEAKAITIIQDARPTLGDELGRWERFAARRLKQGKTLTNAREFETITTPASLKGAIEGALQHAETAEDVRKIFDDVRSVWYPGGY